MRNTVEKVVSALVISATLAACGKSPSVDNQAIQKAANTPAISSPDNRTSKPTMATDSSHSIVIPSMTPFLPETVMTATATEIPVVKTVVKAAEATKQPENAEASESLKRITDFLTGQNGYSNEDLKKISFNPMGVEPSTPNYLGILQGAENGSDGLMQTVLLSTSFDGTNRYYILGSQMRPEMGGKRFVFKAYFPEKMALEKGGGEQLFKVSPGTFNVSKISASDLVLLKSDTDYQIISQKTGRPVVVELIAHADPVPVPQLADYIKLLNDGGAAAVEILNIAQRVASGYNGKYSAGDGSMGDKIFGSGSGIYTSDQLPDQSYLTINNVDPVHTPIVNSFYIAN